MTRSVAQWLAAEPFTLVLSAGFFGFYAHAGLILALDEAGLRPRRIVGTSAGAIAGGVWASGVPASDLLDLLEDLTRADFWDPTWRELPGALRRRARSRSGSSARDPDPGTALGLLRGRKLDALLADALAPVGVERIEDCAIPFAAVTHELRANQTRVHEFGLLRPAIRASAALPVMFGPVEIEGRLHADGGISDRPGFRALEPNERALYHHLPHRSRWPRLSGDEQAERRSTADRVVLALDELPRVHPTALDRGPVALFHARNAARRWLESPRS